MKNKTLKLITSFALCTIAYILLTSSSTGMSGATINGCTCHGGVSNANTVITLSGIPPTGYVKGATYTLTLTVTNVSMQSAGFNIMTGFGTFLIPSAGSRVGITSGNDELFHTSPKTLISNNASWTFQWTAPTQATFNAFEVAANAVNGNGNENGDESNRRTFTFTAGPSSVGDVTNVNDIQLYPNPTSNYSFLKVKHSSEVKQISSFDFLGRRVDCNFTTLDENTIKLNTSNLNSGEYILLLSTDKEIATTKLIKI